MAIKGMDWYIENNDFEGAKERFENTSPSWRNRWFEVCKTIFNNCKELAKFYIVNTVEKTISKIEAIATTRKTKYKEKISVNENCTDLCNEAKEKCYLFEFYDENDNLVCSKVGTTKRTVYERLREELTSDTYKNTGCVRAVINRVYDCGDMPAEGLESYFRAIYIKMFPDSFKKNDRFINTFFDLKQADKIVLSYLGA